MNRNIDTLRMPSRRKKKTQIVVASISLILVIFITYQILSNSNALWKKFTDVEVYDDPSDEFDWKWDIIPDVYDRRGIFPQIMKEMHLNPFKGEKLIHLDLKGAPPVVSYFKVFFPYINSLGATGVLIEYEDMFHYEDELEEIRAFNAYTPSEIKTILELAEENNLQVIPLIQTFGHLEFVLKLEKFKELREVKTLPQVICPSNGKSHFLIEKMIDQVMKAHPKSKYIHIGCDEVIFLAQCAKCKSVIHENNLSKYDLFLNHVKEVAFYIKKTYPGVRPIIWADMIAHIDKMLVVNSGISSLVDLMVWKYVPNVSDYITDEILEFYARVFKNIWIASAFKGATGVNQMTTNSIYHLANHIGWMDIVFRWKDIINFKGIALTGWQRYDHFAMLCELLPVAVPSLTVSMHFLNGSLEEFSNEIIIKVLQCHQNVSVDFHKFPASHLHKCDFPGSMVYNLVQKYFHFYSNLGGHISVMSNGWFSAYNIAHKFSNPIHVKSMFKDWPIDQYLNRLRVLEGDLERALSEVYDQHTVKEWLLSYVTPVRIRLEALSVMKDSLLQQSTWPRRPLVGNSEGLERAAKEICTSDRQFGCAALLL